jgi:DNA (cytosine-5)-methyltransferase 1
VTCGDLFAGIGGLSLGLERAGFSVAWQVEADPFCERILARHWPGVARRRDVRLAGAATLAPVDLIAGSPPCQDVSKARGAGDGLRGRRSGLWREFRRIVGELSPRWVLVENVPALRCRGADVLLADLEALGYATWPLVVGARDVGAPHARDRIWIVGHADRPRLEGRRLCHDRDADQRIPGPPGVPERWPARPGERQHEWEAPRLAQSRVGRGAHGFSARLDSMTRRRRIQALGNAVVPQVAAALGRAIRALDGAPAWVPCDCEAFWCVIHKRHAYECPCPPREDWPVSPYGTRH